MQELEKKFVRVDSGLSLQGDAVIAGYASLFDQTDQGGDTVRPGAFAKALKRLAAEGRQVKMLWQHDPAQPIGVWQDIREDARGLWVKGTLLPEVAQAREALALIQAGALDGLSIGYRTKRAHKAPDGQRHLLELDLWEVSLVTFPMLSSARLTAEQKAAEMALGQLAATLRQARDVIRADRR